MPDSFDDGLVAIDPATNEPVYVVISKEDYPGLYEVVEVTSWNGVEATFKVPDLPPGKVAESG